MLRVVAAMVGPEEAPAEAQQPGQVQRVPLLVLPSPLLAARLPAQVEEVPLWGALQPLQEAAAAEQKALVPAQVAAGEGVTAAEPTACLWVVAEVAVSWCRCLLRACGGV